MVRISSDRNFYLDLGSTSTKVLYKGHVIWHQPTCIALHTHTHSVLSLGSSAYELVGKTTNAVTVAFPIQHGFVTDAQLFEQYMGALLKKLRPNIPLLDHLVGLPGKLATLSCLTAAEKQVLTKLLPHVGLRRMQLVSQAAAAVHGLDVADRTQAHGCLIDMGGQVTEVSLIIAGVISQTIRLPWGGVQLTEEIQKALAEQTACAISWNAAEKIKCEIGSVVEEKKNEKQSVWGKQVTTHLGKTLVISTADVLPICLKFAHDLVRAIKSILSEAQPQVVTTALEQGLFCIGGGSQLRGWEQFLSQELQTHIVLPPEPDLVVVRGMADMVQQH